MPLTAAENHINQQFLASNSANAKASLSRPSALAEALEKNLLKSAGNSFASSTQLNAMFATAAVEMWLRATHSFLMSASTTLSSPIWSSVSGYYASHYAMRAFSHSLGYFHVFRRKKLVRLDLQTFSCLIEKKGASDREHIVYWRLVKDNKDIGNDPFFSHNEDQRHSDSAHRNRANYSDHICAFPEFRVLDEKALRARLKILSEMELSAVPAIDREKFPDLDSVQIVAYHRIVRFRRLLDDILGNRIRIWNENRNPAWSSNFLDFQVTEPRLISAVSAVA